MLYFPGLSEGFIPAQLDTEPAKESDEKQDAPEPLKGVFEDKMSEITRYQSSLWLDSTLASKSVPEFLEREYGSFEVAQAVQNASDNATRSV